TAIQQKFLQLWGRLPKLYRRFNDALVEQKLTTTARIYRDLVEGHAAQPEFVSAYKQVAFVGFNALNQCEKKLFTQWQDADKALFYFDADRYYLDDDLQEAGLFLRKNITQYGLRHALGELPAVLATKASCIELVAASGNVAQAKRLSTLLANRSAKRDTPTSTAIILADESLLVPVLQSLPDNVDFNVTMGYPLTQSTLFGYLDSWLNIQQQLAANRGRFVHHLDVEAVLLHPLIGLVPDERDNLQTNIQTNEWREVPASELRLKSGSYPDFFVPRRGSEAVLTALHSLLDGVLAYRQKSHHLPHIEAVLILAVKKALNLLQEGYVVIRSCRCLSCVH